MLVEECGRIQQRIQDYLELRAAAEVADAYATRLNMLKSAADVLYPLVQSHRALRARGIADDLPTSVSDGIRSRLGQVRSEYVRGPDSILAQQALGTIPRDLQGLAQRISAKLAASWTAYVDGQHVEISEQLLAVLDQVPDLRAATKQVRSLQVQISVRRATLPKTEPDIDALDRLVVELRLKWHQLAGDGLPTSVLAFIRGAASGGAQLELLTDEVREWLVSRGVKDAFHVVVRRTV
jgi:hypothetical protein